MDGRIAEVKLRMWADMDIHYMTEDENDWDPEAYKQYMLAVMAAEILEHRKREMENEEARTSEEVGKYSTSGAQSSYTRD